MVAYTLLIVIAITLSVGVYSYLKFYTPSEKAECPTDTNLVIEGATCQDGWLNITLANRGLFNVTAFFVRLGESSREVRKQVNENKEIFPSPLAPTRKIGFSFTIPPGILTSSEDYTLEVQAATLSKRRIIPCERYIVTQDVKCTLSGVGDICGDGMITGSEECDPNANPVFKDYGDGINQCVNYNSSQFIGGNLLCNGATCLISTILCEPIGTCPNGFKEGIEECDDNNTINKDDCINTCISAKCGDGIIWNLGNGTEQCDDANNVIGDGCNNTCQIEAGWECSGEPSSCNQIASSGALSFDGIDDYVVVGKGSNFSDLCINGCGFSGWSSGRGGFILGRSDSDQDNRFFSISGPSINFYIRDDGSGLASHTCFASTFVPLNEWHHFATVYDTNQDKIFVYVDGEEKTNSSCPFTQINQIAWQDLEDTFIGVVDDSTPNPNNYWNGSIDDVRFYNGTLTPAEILELNNSGPDANNVTNGLQGWWKFNDGSGNVANDSSGNGHNGEVVGATWIIT